MFFCLRIVETTLAPSWPKSVFSATIDVLEALRSDPLGDAYVDERIRRREAEDLGILLRRKLVGPHVGADPGDVVFVRHLGLGERHRGMEFAENRRRVVARDQPHGCGAAFGGLTLGVLIDHF